MTQIETSYIGLIRHSITIWNQEKKIQGQQDSPLSSEGEKIARSWGPILEKYKWDQIISSDLGRAIRTTAIINQSLQLPCSTDSRLREQDWGSWCGLTLNEIKEREKATLKDQVRKGWKFQPPGGESRFQVLDRAYQAVKEARARYPHQNLLMVCHEGVIKCLLYHLSARLFLPEENKILNPYHLHLLEGRADSIVIKSINHCPLSG